MPVINGSSYLLRTCVCHSRSVKRISTIPDSPYEFLSCGQDGLVLHHDLRLNHRCIEACIEAKLYPHILVDYSTYRIELHSISLNRFRPYLFAIGGSTRKPIFLHDRRMIPNDSGNSKVWTGRTNCLARCQPSSFNGSNDTSYSLLTAKHVTAVKFSATNSHELLGSWSLDHIYLFDINGHLPHRHHPTDYKSDKYDVCLGNPSKPSSLRKRRNATHSDSNQGSSHPSDDITPSLLIPEKHTCRRRVRQRANTRESIYDSANAASDSGPLRVSVHLSGSGSHSHAEDSETSALISDNDHPTGPTRDALEVLDLSQRHMLGFYHTLAERDFHKGNYRETLEHISTAIRQVSDGTSHSSSGDNSTNTSDVNSIHPLTSFAERRHRANMVQQQGLRKMRSTQYSNRALTYLHCFIHEWLVFNILPEFAPKANGVNGGHGTSQLQPVGLETSPLLSESHIESPDTLLRAIRRDTEIAIKLNSNNVRAHIISALGNWLKSYVQLHTVINNLCTIASSLNGPAGKDDYNLQLRRFESEQGSVEQHLESAENRVENLISNATNDIRTAENELRTAMQNLNQHCPSNQATVDTTGSHPLDNPSNNAEVTTPTILLSPNHTDFGISSESGCC